MTDSAKGDSGRRFGNHEIADEVPAGTGVLGDAKVVSDGQLVEQLDRLP